MAKYTLKKDGFVYNNKTGKKLNVCNIRGVKYYNLYVNGKTRKIQIDPFWILTGYSKDKEYDLDVEDGFDEDKFFNKHLEIMRQKYENAKKNNSEFYTQTFIDYELRQEMIKYGKTD